MKTIRPTRHLDVPNRDMFPRVRHFSGRDVPAWWVEQHMFDEPRFEVCPVYDVKETAADAECGAAAAYDLLRPYLRMRRVAR